MPLPTINSVNPTSVPAGPAITFAQAFLTNLTFIAPDMASKWTAAMQTRNYDAASSTLAPDTPGNINRVVITDVAAYMAEFPLFAQTLATVLTVAGMVMAERAAQSAMDTANRLPAGTAKDAAVAAAQPTLTAARQALGAAS